MTTCSKYSAQEYEMCICASRISSTCISWGIGVRAPIQCTAHAYVHRLECFLLLYIDISICHPCASSSDCESVDEDELNLAGEPTGKKVKHVYKLPCPHRSQECSRYIQMLDAHTAANSSKRSSMKLPFGTDENTGTDTDTINKRTTTWTHRP